MTTGRSGPKKVGAYEVDGLLGKGGMGEVWKATHPRLERPVALKRLLAQGTGRSARELKEDADLVERFAREGRAMARLRHEGIPCVYDLLEHRGEQWMALEYVDGFNVEELLRGGSLPPDVAVLIGIGVARALAVAHRAGILHRDVKPANVMVNTAGVVKLMDFGIARDDRLPTLTETGGVVGTPPYLPPEVVKGEPPAACGDVYAVGCLLYEMLAGQRVFAHANAQSIWALVANGKFPRLGKLAPHLPWRLTLLVERALKTDPRRRPGSAAELAALLERFLDEYGGPDDPALRLTGWLVAVGKVPEETLTAMLPDTTSLYVVHEEIKLRRRLVPWRFAALTSMLVTVATIAALVFLTDVDERLMAALTN